MDYQEITLGEGTYEVSRVCAGPHSAAELLTEYLVKRLEEKPPFDERDRDAV